MPGLFASVNISLRRQAKTGGWTRLGKQLWWAPFCFAKKKIVLLTRKSKKTKERIWSCINDSKGWRASYNLHPLLFLLNVGLSTEWCIMGFLWVLENLAEAFTWTLFWQVSWRSPLTSWLSTTATGNNKPNSKFQTDYMIFVQSNVPWEWSLR